jgi:hypothetical protein
MVLQCNNGVGSNPVEGRTKIWQLYIYIYIYVWKLYQISDILNPMMFVSFNINTTGVTSGAETANPSWAPEFIPVCSGVRVARHLLFYIVYDRSFFCHFVPFRFPIVLSDLHWFADSHYLFGIFVPLGSCCSIFSFLWNVL